MEPVISINQRLEPADLHFCRVANRHHRRVKEYHKKRQEQFVAKVCLYAKRTLAFSGFALFLLCLWTLR